MAGPPLFQPVLPSELDQDADPAQNSSFFSMGREEPGPFSAGSRSAELGRTPLSSDTSWLSFKRS